MKFLADESCDFAVVRTLLDAGYEVLAVSEVSPGASDDAVMALAAQENRILLTRHYRKQKTWSVTRRPLSRRSELAREEIGRRQTGTIREQARSYRRGARKEQVERLMVEAWRSAGYIHLTIS